MARKRMVTEFCPNRKMPRICIVDVDLRKIVEVQLDNDCKNPQACHQACAAAALESIERRPWEEQPKTA